MLSSRAFLAIGTVLASSMIVTAGSAPTVTAATSYETWTGVVQRTSDGDTLRVDLDGNSGSEVAIRLIGVNAFELGECSADTATNLLDNITNDEHVTMQVAADLGPDKFGRYHAYVELSSGGDIAEDLLEAGTVWPVPKDWSRDDKTLDYYNLAVAARDNGVGIWDDQACGTPPSSDAEFELRILRNPDGLDADDPNKEWVKILNHGSTIVDLAGWGLRSSGEEKFTFPANTTLGPNDSIKVHAGSGNDRSGHRYWGLDRPMFANDRAESVVLIDDLGNIRGFKQSPCLADCSDPLRGKVELRASYDAPGSDATNPNGEWVEMLNVSTERIDLVDYMLINDQNRFIPAGGAKIDPGERIRVYVGQGNGVGPIKYWGKTSGILANSGDQVVLRNIDGVRIATLEWPCAACAADLADLDIVFANPDAPGTDDNALDQEYVIVRNSTGSSVDLTDWAVRSGSNWFRFDNTVLAAEHTIRLVSGIGTDQTVGNEHVIHWNRTTAALPNSDGSVELVGPNLAVADCYGWGDDPCEDDRRPVRLSITVTADPLGSDTINANNETIRLKNKEASAIDLSGFRVTHNGYVYTVAEGTVIGRNNALTVHAGSGNNTNHHQYWETAGGILANSGGVVVVYDADGYWADQEIYD